MERFYQRKRIRVAQCEELNWEKSNSVCTSKPISIMITQPQVRAPQRCSSKGKSEGSSQKYYRHKKIWRQDTKILKKKINGLHRQQHRAKIPPTTLQLKHKVLHLIHMTRMLHLIRFCEWKQTQKLETFLVMHYQRSLIQNDGP